MSRPDVVTLLVDYLDGLGLASGLDVVVERPRTATRDDTVLQVRRVGGPALPPVRDAPTIDLKSWAASAQEAMANLLLATEAIWTLHGTEDLGVVCYDVTEVMGPRHMTDQVTGGPYAWATIRLVTRADAIVPYNHPTTS